MARASSAARVARRHRRWWVAEEDVREDKGWGTWVGPRRSMGGPRRSWWPARPGGSSLRGKASIFLRKMLLFSRRLARSRPPGALSYDAPRSDGCFFPRPHQPVARKGNSHPYPLDIARSPSSTTLAPPYQIPHRWCSDCGGAAGRRHGTAWEDANRCQRAPTRASTLRHLWPGRIRRRPPLFPRPSPAGSMHRFLPHLPLLLRGSRRLADLRPPLVAADQHPPDSRATASAHRRTPLQPPTPLPLHIATESPTGGGPVLTGATKDSGWS
jgi:hypothetical protein